MWLGLLTLTVLLSLGLTGRVRRYALVRRILDIPNFRSSHSVPTPRGGGVAIVVLFLAALPLLVYLGALSTSVMLGLFGAGAFIALIGFIDDHRDIAARWRLVGHFLCAAWLLSWLGGAPPVGLLGGGAAASGIAHGIVILGLVWLLNLYNFMDGIDGLAAVEALCVCAGGALLYMLLGYSELALTPLFLASAVLGFLYWNFPPARIFMGDAGSGFLGLMLGGLALQAAWVASELFWAWLILLGVFIVDATWTLLHRVVRRERFYEGHRSHAYQFASRQYGAHRPVTLAVMLLNLLWLMPLAVAVALGFVGGAAGLVIAYTPLAFLAWWFKAGSAE